MDALPELDVPGRGKIVTLYARLVQMFQFFILVL